MKAILHADKEWGIGKNNSLMFKIPADMQFFKRTTTGNVVIMGSNTLKSLPEGKPLKDRVNIVLYPGGEERADCIVLQTLDELFWEIKKREANGEKIYVIGGHMMFKTLLPYCEDVLVTKVDAVGGADAYFENLDENPNFRLEYSSRPEITNGYTIRFTSYKNLNVQKY